MSDYGRVPVMEISNESKTDEEKEVFELKETSKEVSKEDDKKTKLREHLARCREKSAKVRAEKKNQKLANKKSVGRPKKNKIDVDVIVEPVEEVEEVKEEHIFKQKEIPPPEIIREIEIPPPASHTNPMFDIDMLLNKLDARIDTKFKSFQPPQQQAPQPSAYPQLYQPPPQFNEESIRSDERRRMKEERDKQKQQVINQRTNQYYKKLPPASYINSGNEWDNLLNPRRYH